MKILLPAILAVIVLSILGADTTPINNVIPISRDTIRVTVRITDTLHIDSVLIHWGRAVSRVESNGRLTARRFEPAFFKRLTGHSARDFASASRIDYHSAMLSTSFGKYQILGINYKAAGFRSVEALASAGCADQDKGFVRFVKSKHLDRFVKYGQLKAFAKAYNGSQYQRNKYDSKLMAALG